MAWIPVLFGARSSREHPGSFQQPKKELKLKKSRVNGSLCVVCVYIMVYGFRYKYCHAVLSSASMVYNRFAVVKM